MSVMNIRAFPDEDIALYVRSKDSETFREIIFRYEKKLIRYMTFLVKNDLTAHGLVQTTFLTVYRDLNQYSPRLKFSSWMYRKAHEEFAHFYKAQRKTTQAVGSYPGLFEELISDDDFENEFSDPKLVKHIAQYASNLKVMYREPLVLHFIEQRSYDEIRDILQLPVTIIAGRITKGRRLIEKKYGKAS